MASCCINIGDLVQPAINHVIILTFDDLEQVWSSTVPLPWMVADISIEVVAHSFKKKEERTTVFTVIDPSGKRFLVYQFQRSSDQPQLKLFST